MDFRDGTTEYGIVPRVDSVLDDDYSLEEILAEFKQPEGAEPAKQTAKQAPPAAKPALKSTAAASHKTLSEEEMQRQEAALAARMEARRKEQEKKKDRYQSGTLLRQMMPALQKR